MDPRIKKVIDEIWPRTKVELERAAKTSKALIDKGEAQMRNASRTGVRELKKLSLTLKKDALYFKLGKSIATTARDEWPHNRKIAALLRDIHSVERNIKSVTKPQI